MPIPLPEDSTSVATAMALTVTALTQGSPPGPFIYRLDQTPDCILVHCLLPDTLSQALVAGNVMTFAQLAQAAELSDPFAGSDITEIKNTVGIILTVLPIPQADDIGRFAAKLPVVGAATEKCWVTCWIGI